MKPYILIVEDEAALLTLLRYNLEKGGFEVGEAVDGEEALLMVDERRPDLMVLDWMLPTLSGIEVCRRIRRKPDARPAPHHHADGTRRGGGQGARPRRRRRRLRGQALLPGRASGAHPRDPAPHAARVRRRDAALRRPHDGPRRPQGHARRRAGPPRADRVPAAAPPDGASGPRVSRASSFSIRSGGRTSSSRAGRSTCTCAGCGRRSTRTGART